MKREQDPQPLVTIGIPTYNHSDQYLQETLDSALAQTYENIEIVVADNCSTDGTRERVSAIRDKRIRYVRHDRNISANDNFNFCLQEAKGEYFQLLHDDDLIDRDFIEVCIRSFARRRDVGLVRTGARIIDDAGRTLRELENVVEGPAVSDLFLAWFESKTWMFLCSTLFKTEALRLVGGFNSRRQLFQDVLAEFRVAARFGYAAVRPVKAALRKHGAQNTHAAKIEAWCEDSMQLLETICALVPERQQMLRQKGQVHFAKHNYDLAQTISQPVQRYRTYWAIHRAFGRAYSPLRFLSERAYARLWAHLGQTKRRLLGQYAA